MDNKAIAGICCLIILAASAATYLWVDDGDDRKGTWYATYSETGASLTGDILVREYDMCEERNPLVIDSIVRDVFKGTLDGVPIVGSIIGDELRFETQVNGSDWHVEAYYVGEDIVFSYLVTSGNGFLGAGFIQYTPAGGIPSSVSALSMDLMIEYDAIGSVEFKDEAVSTVPDAPMRVIDQGCMVAVAEMDVLGITNTLFMVGIGYHDGCYRANMFGQVNGDLEVGRALFHDDVMEVNFDCVGDANGIYNILSTYAVDTIFGDEGEDADLYGTWVGKLLYMRPDGSITTSEVTKSIEDARIGFYSCIEVLPDGTTFNWMVRCQGDYVTVMVLNGPDSSGECIGYLFGTCDGDNLVLAGSQDDGDGGYSICFDLVRTA